MTISGVVFVILLLLSAIPLALGRWLGERRKVVRLSALWIALVLIVLAALPRFRPTLLHTTLPLEISIYLEGVLAAFPWMLLVGVLWSGRFSKRFRRAAPLMWVLGLVYFLFGGIWMMLPNIQVHGPERRLSETETFPGVTVQSRPDSCVPAACATALRLLGVPVTEGDICHVVQAKPGRGSTLARAALGLRDLLSRHDIGVEVKNLTAEEVMYQAHRRRPILVVIKSNPTADHMVAVLGRFGSAVAIANPSPGEHGGVQALPNESYPGIEMFRFEDFEKLYRRGAIVFDLVDAPLPHDTRAEPPAPSSEAD